MVQAPSIKLSQDAKKAIKIQAWVVVWWEENSEEKSCLKYKRDEVAGAERTYLRSGLFISNNFGVLF